MNNKTGIHLHSFIPAFHALFALLALLALLALISLPAQSRDRIVLTTGWKFHKGPVTGATAVKFDDSKWEEVSVPHDWAISGPFIEDGDGNTGKLPWKGEGWYRRNLDIPAEYKGQHILLMCDGIMASPEIFVNGKAAGTWDYGYNSFYIDITAFVSPGGRNLLAIHADTRNHDSRWYPGAGIFRKVTMLVVNPIHIDVWGISVTTPVIKPNYAEVRVATQICNQSASDASGLEITTLVLNPEGREIARKVMQSDIPASQTRLTGSSLVIPDPRLWDVGKGVLYTVKTIIRRNGAILDSASVPFGIRTMRFTADHGFYLNDRRVQLKGVNLHHDFGPLGAAFNVRAMERQLELLQSMGCNAIRTSHNAPAPEVPDLCDRMGILVFDELFDKYDRKADYSDSLDFDAFALRNVRNFVMRDRNHPSVFLWSVGNEMGDVQGNVNNGFTKLQTMVNYFRKFDGTRPVTMVCDNRNSALLRHFDYYDVHCWNYGRRYDLARQMEPGKAVIISESASTVSTRGFYELPLPEKKTDFTRSLQVSSYDLNAPWWAEIADDDFMWQQDEAYVAGEFAWTGFDYLGEPTPKTNEWAKENGLGDRDAAHSSFFGIFDLCGLPKDRYFLYRSYWMPEETTIHILPHWNWAGMEGKKVPVFVYTNGDCAELFLNGRSLGKQYKNPASSISAERFRLMWKDVVYEPGELVAVAYKEGLKTGEERVRTTGPAHLLRLTADRTAIRADGQDLSFITIEAVDKDGFPNPLADQPVSLALTGPGAIAGVGNGNQHSFEPFQGSTIRLFYGKAVVIIRSTGQPGQISVTATSPGLLPGESGIKTQ